MYNQKSCGVSFGNPPVLVVVKGLELEILFKGGTPVHITSGFSALAYAIAVGPRRTAVLKKHKPSNPSDIYLGTILLWFGWFGFNGILLFCMDNNLTWLRGFQ